MKKIIKTLIIISILISVVYFGIYLIQNYSLKKSFSNETNTILDHDTKLIRCNYNILSPEFAFTFETGKGGIIGFHRLRGLFYATKKKWDDGDLGTTTIKNTTFPELLKMVKEDCSQFQKGYLDYADYEHLSDEEKEERYYEISEKNLGWIYTPNEPKTEKELQRERVQKIKEKMDSNLTEEELEAERQLLKKIHGFE